MNGYKITITGGAGFIGSNLAEELTGKNEVTVFDDLSTGNMGNIAGLDVKLIRGSITDSGALKSAFAGTDYVFHLAARRSVPRSRREPILVNAVNVTGTLNVLVAARDAGVKKVVFAASSSAYGDTPTLPKVETMAPNPLSPYAITKLTGELYCRVFNDVYRLPTVALRYFNVYGPRQDPDSEYAAVIPKFVRALKAGHPPVIFGDGEQTRDFTYVGDAVRGTILAAELSGAYGNVVNISVGKRITLNGLSRKLGELTGRADIKTQHASPRDGDVRHSLADITLASESLGYEPAHSIDEGLGRVVASIAGKE